MLIESTPIERINHSALNGWEGELWLKRDDLIHSEISGNKWRKLKEYVIKLKNEGKDGIITFGGAHSNHIAATAAAGKLLGFKTIGIIRGDELNANSNNTLNTAHESGMQLLFVSREEYQLKSDYGYQKQLRLELGNYLLVPEGGGGFYGMMGCQDIVRDHKEFDCFAVACGTGTTAAGMVIGQDTRQKVLCFSALKGDWMRDEINKRLQTYFLDPHIHLEYEHDFEVYTDYHFGGYAKINEQLISFIRNFYSETGIKLDPVYTGKMMYGLFDQLLSNKKFHKKKLLALHTGGLQGIQGVEAVLGQRIF